MLDMKSISILSFGFEKKKKTWYKQKRIETLLNLFAFKNFQLFVVFIL